MDGHPGESTLKVRDPDELDRKEDEEEHLGRTPDELEHALLSAMKRVLSPREKLVETSLGKRSAQLDDVTGLLANRLVDSDEQAAHLSQLSRQFLDCFFAAERTLGPDPELTLEVAERLSKLYARHMAETRRTADLMCRIVAPTRPNVKIMAAVQADQVNLSSQQQINNRSSGDLGDR